MPQRLTVEAVRQPVRQQHVESMRIYYPVHSVAVLARPLSKVGVYVTTKIPWSLPDVLNQSWGVVIPGTLLAQQRAHPQPNGMSRQMGRRGRFCRKANQPGEGTVWCSLTDCRACGLFVVF